MSEPSTPPSVAYRSFGAELIAEERQRHITAEGWTPESDARYTNEQLARAAVCYAMPRLLREMEVYETLHDGLAQGPVPRLWPWQRHFWKPTHRDRMRELVKAGALIAAEIDRLHESAKRSSVGGDPS
jgi:hypothetical protein